LLTPGQWLVPRSQREPQPPQNTRAYYAPGSFGMQEHAEPPPGASIRIAFSKANMCPVYSNTDMPPSYQPPEGGSKVALELAEQRRTAQLQQESGSASGPVPARTV
jgi:hypothetical protein